VKFDFIIRGTEGKRNGKMVGNRQLIGEKTLNQWLKNKKDMAQCVHLWYIIKWLDSEEENDD